VGKGALAPCPPGPSHEADGGHASLCSPYTLRIWHLPARWNASDSNFKQRISRHRPAQPSEGRRRFRSPMTGRPSIPEAPVIESRSPGVLDAPLSRSMTVSETHTRIPAARIAPESCKSFAQENREGAGKPGARCTRSLARKQKSARASSPQVHRNNPAFPAQWF